MAYFGSLNNIMTAGSVAQDTAFALKTALVAAGWTVQGSSNGTTWNNTASGDNLPNYAAWNAAGSWVRLREPSGVGGREYVIMRGSGAGLILKYSRSVGFATGGGPTTLPTTGNTGDGLVWWGSQAGFSATGTGTNTYDQASLGTGQQVALTVGGGYLSCVASNTPVNGVYGFWLIAYLSGTAALQFQLFSEGMDPTSCSPLDFDPSVRQLSGGNWWANDLGATTLVQYWQGYPSPWSSPTTATYRLNAPALNTAGTVNASMVNNGGVYPTSSSTPSQSPYNNKTLSYPMFISGTGTAGAAPPVGNTPKGFTTDFRSTFGNYNALSTFDLSTASPRIIFGAGGPLSTSLNISIPWVTNQIPLV